MIIWYISKYATPSKYFFGTRHFYLSEEWVKNGVDVSVITSNSSHLSNNLPKFESLTFVEFINGVRTIWVNTFKSRKSSGLSRIISWLDFDLKLLFFSKKKISNPDVIILSSLSLTTILPAWILSKKYNAKLVFEIRDIWPLSIIILGNYSKFNPFIIYLSWLEKFGYKKSNLIVGTMPNLEEHVKNNCNISTKCICIPQGLSINFYNNEQIEIETKYIIKNIPNNKFIICYAGTLNINNPLEAFINAAEILKNETHIHFIILGDGNLKKYYEEISKYLPNISFPPTIHKNQVYAFLKNVDICYDSFDSKLAKYGLSRNKWIDYMYASKPIICSYDGFQSMINDADCGTFVKFNDSIALAEVIKEYSFLTKIDIQNIGERGKKYLLENRTFENLSKKYLEEIYNS
jgi:hypothetical protein